MVVNMNTIDHLDTNLIMPDDIPFLTPSDIASRTRGSKLVLVVEQSMIMTQWGCKVSLLLLYNRLTFGLRQQLAVKIVGAYVVLNLIIMEILYFGVWCRPFYDYWAVPTPNEQCSAAIHHLITNAVFNISSDLLMLMIPLPLLLKSRLPVANKLILCVLFSLGIFVILCAVLNKYYSFAHPFSPMWEYWYIREASTAIYVANMPMCWSLLRRLFNLRAFDGITSQGARSKSAPKIQIYSNSRAGSKAGIEVGRMRKDTSWWDREAGFTEWKSDSEEFINGTGSHGKGSNVPLEIWEEREVDIDRGSPSGGSSEREIGDQGMRSMEMGMFDGSGKEFETRTTVSVAGTKTSLGRSPSQKLGSSGSRSRSRGNRSRGNGSGSGSEEGSRLGTR